MLRAARLILAAAFAALALPAAAEPALWVIKDANSTIYLFGTVHYLRPTTQWRGPRVNKALAEAGDLVLEVPVDAAGAAAVQAVVAELGMDPAHPLSGRLSARDRARLAKAIGKLGVAPARMEPMRPWMAALTLSVVPALNAGYDPNAGVEPLLSAEMARRGAPVVGLETAAQQLHFMADLPEKQQVAFLASTLDDIDESVAEIDKLVAAWTVGDTKTLEAEFITDMKGRYPDLYRVLIANRNAAWAQALKAKLAGSGVSFVAVGAGHLVGPDSVQADLAKLGVTVERVR